MRLLNFNSNVKIFFFVFSTILFSTNFCLAQEEKVAPNIEEVDLKNPILPDSILNQVNQVVDSFIALDIRIQKELPLSSKIHAESLFIAYHRFVQRELLPLIGKTVFMRFQTWGYSDTGVVQCEWPAPASLSSKELKLYEKLFKNGIRITGLGIGSRLTYLEDYRYTKRFKKYVSAEFGWVLSILEMARAKDLDGNGACGISLSIPEIGDRVSEYEDFLLKYPLSAYAPLINSLYYRHLDAFLFNHENHSIELNTKDKFDCLPYYKQYIKKYSKKRSATYVRQMLRLRKENNWKQPEKMYQDLIIPRPNNLIYEIY